MSRRQEHRLAVHHFRTLDELQFNPVDYSRLKFGSDIVAKQFGYELADAVFAAYSEVLIANQCVVIPSPYNYVQNAASVMARHMTDRLNHLLAQTNGGCVEWSVIHRKVSYTVDYGYLPKEKRRALIDNDEFYFNDQFVDGKVLLFVDDIYITGTHEEKLREIMDKAGRNNRSFFLYYGQALPGVAPETEAALNFSGMKSLHEYLKLMEEPNHHTIVRPIKYILSRDPGELDVVLTQMKTGRLHELYHGALGEGYHKLPNYQKTFQMVREEVLRREASPK